MDEQEPPEIEGETHEVIEDFVPFQTLEEIDAYIGVSNEELLEAVSQHSPLLVRLQATAIQNAKLKHVINTLFEEV